MKFLIALSLLVSVCLADDDDDTSEGLNDLKVTDEAADMIKMAGLVSFNLYTRKNTDAPQILTLGDMNSVSSSNFDSSKPTYLAVHGWSNSLSDVSIQGPKTALLLRYDCNVIGVDWGKIASAPYLNAVAGVPRVGAYVAKMLTFLHSSAKLDLKRTHLIGHSLGAQVCGFAGKNLKGLGLARITGLDPARPGFKLAGPTRRLDKTDADFVDCIFSNAGKLGFLKPICGANFYPNGGRRQPGCGIDLNGFCSHRRSHDLFTESVSGKSKFTASKCLSVPNRFGLGCFPSKALMGEPADPSLKGIYYVKTNSRFPFAMDS